VKVQRGRKRPVRSGAGYSIMPGYLDYGIPASGNLAIQDGRGTDADADGCEGRARRAGGHRARSPLTATFSIYRGALERAH